MRTEIFKRQDVFIRNKGKEEIWPFFDKDIVSTNEYNFHLKSARDRMLLMKADFALVVINDTKAWIIKNRQTGELGEITSKEYPEYFL